MKIIDLHQDLLLHIRYRELVGQSYQTDFSMLEASDVEVCFATAFPYPADNDQQNPVVNDLITEELKMYAEHCEANDNWQIVTSQADLDRLGKKLLLHIEGLNVFTGLATDWDRLDAWYESGLRSLAPHWNISNALGGGTQDPVASLTELGESVISWTEKRGIICDFAHMGRQTFLDAAKKVTRPILVSHGNVDAVCPSPRNYTDDQLRIIAESGGTIGVFFASKFVSGGDGTSCTISDVVKHLSYLRTLIGSSHISIGSDFGGILSPDIPDLHAVSEFQNLFTALTEAGFSESDIAAIAYENASRVIRDHLD